ncbi:MAG TPA: hypothetical protein VGP90_12585 [Acidimicrobiia bacterium]|jgi:hypothetical protein|nr:hypothetical protein [Acidimicrobiia bacterium]
MTWSRRPVAAALVDLLGTATGGTVTVFAEQPLTLNPPALVVADATVRFSRAALSVDEVDLPVLCIGPAGASDDVDALAGTVRAAVDADRTLGGAVQIVYAAEQRNARHVNIAGIDLKVLEVGLSITM